MFDLLRELEHVPRGMEIGVVEHFTAGMGRYVT
jgi:hypothetical protein